MAELNSRTVFVGVVIVVFATVATTWAQSDELPRRLRGRISRVLVDDNSSEARMVEVVKVQSSPTGACCFGNGFCTPQTQADCEAVEGQVYLGDEIECVGDFTCPAVCRTCQCLDGFQQAGQSAVGCVAEESACDDLCLDHGGTQSFQCDLGPCVAACGGAPDFILEWGSNGTGDGQFAGAHGIEVDTEGNVYVVDTGNHRIQKFTSNGVFLIMGSLGRRSWSVQSSSRNRHLPDG